MINILKIRLITIGLPLLSTLFTYNSAHSQTIEFTTPEGSIKFQLVENQKSVTNHVLAEMGLTGADSVTLTGAIPGFILSVLPSLRPMPLADSVKLQPTGPHYRGVLTVPVDVDLTGKRILRLDRMMVVHGKSYTPADVKTVHSSFTSNLKKDLFIRLCDTVIKYRYTPLPDSLKDRYGRADRKKLKAATLPLMDSLSRVFAHPDITEEEIAGYESRNGLPSMDGKYLIIATLTEGEDVLNKIMNGQVNKTSRVHWSRVTE